MTANNPEGRVCEKCNTVEPHYVCDPENAGRFAEFKAEPYGAEQPYRGSPPAFSKEALVMTGNTGRRCECGHAREDHLERQHGWCISFETSDTMRCPCRLFRGRIEDESPLSVRIPAAITRAEREFDFMEGAITATEVALAKALWEAFESDPEMAEANDWEAPPALIAFMEKVESL